MEERLHQQHGVDRLLPPPVPSFESLCRQNYPLQWRVLSVLMWVLFATCVGATLSYQFWQADKARAILAGRTEVIGLVSGVTSGLKGANTALIPYPLTYRWATKSTPSR